MFPFLYKQWRYRTCSTWENNGIPWCATSVDSYGTVVDHGNCVNSCKGKQLVPQIDCENRLWNRWIILQH